jgi:hypothetical protein
LHANVNKGTVIRDAEKEIKLTKVNTPSPQPQILEVKDSVSRKVDEILTSGGVVEVNGINIKITGNDEACSLYFVAEDTEIKAATLTKTSRHRYWR